MKRSRIKTSLLAIACALSLGGLVGISSTFAAQEAETAHAVGQNINYKFSTTEGNGTSLGDYSWSPACSGKNLSGIASLYTGVYFTLNPGASFTWSHTNPRFTFVSGWLPPCILVSATDATKGLAAKATVTCGTYSASVDSASDGTIHTGPFEGATLPTSYNRQPGPFTVTVTNQSSEQGILAWPNPGNFEYFIERPPQVSFDKQGGSNGDDSVLVDKDEKLPDITIPTKTDCNFGGYFSEENGAGKQYYDADGKGVTAWDKSSDATLYAYWISLRPTVNISAGTGVSSVFTSADESADTRNPSGTAYNPGATVYGFAEVKPGYQAPSTWVQVSDSIYRVNDGEVIVLGKNEVDFGTQTAEQIEYSITYHLDGGTVETPNPDSYTIDTETFTLNNPVKSGYTFTGWLGDGMEEPSMTLTINKGSTGDKNIYAQWSTDIALDPVTGTSQVWDGNPHTISNLSFREVSSGDLLSDYEIRYSDDSGLSYALSQAPSFIDVGTYEIFYQVTKSGYTTLQGTVTLTIEKADSTFVTSPSAKTGLEFKNQDQELIVPGEADYGDVLYAVNATGELPAEDQFTADIPTGNTVGTYYVFYKTTGDSNHNPIDVDASNKLSVDIGRVSRASVEALSEEVDWFLNFAKDKSAIIDIASTLKGVKYEVTRDAIDEDNVVAEDVEANATKLQNAIDTAEISATKTLIDEIGELTYDGGREDSLEDINVAKTIYDHLNESQKAEVDEANGSTLKHALEVYGHVDDVADLIKAIPTPSAEQEYYDAVAAAENAYSALTEEEKTLLSTSPDFNFKKSLDNELAVKEVIQTIEAIGELTYDGGRNDSLEDILAAKSAYNALGESEKAALDEASLSALNHALEVYGHVDHVADLIQAIPTPSASKAYYDAIDLAKTEYEKLTEEEKALLGECPDYDYVKSLDDHLAVKEVVQTIEAIGEVTYNKGQDDSKESIESAEEAYENLSEEQKQLVDQANYDKLADDRETYDSVEEAIQLIEAIGEVNHGGENDSEADIEAAREAYDQLSDEEKALVDGYNDSGKTLEDNEAVYEVLTVIDEIGEVGSGPDAEEKIKAAREAYDSLTDEQKAKLGDRAVAVLVNAEEEYANLQGGNNGLVIALLVVASLALLGGVIFLIVSIKKAMDGGNGNKPMKAMSIVPFFPVAILSSRYLDAPFIALYIIGGLAVLIWIVNLVFVLLKKRNKVAKVSEEEKQETAKTNAEPVTESVKETPLSEAEVALSSTEEPSLAAKEEAKPNEDSRVPFDHDESLLKKGLIKESKASE